MNRFCRAACVSVFTVAWSSSAAAQLPNAPILQNVWANPGMVGAFNMGGGSGGSVYAGAGSWTPSSGRFQVSGGLGAQVLTNGGGSNFAYGARLALPLGGAGSSFGFGAFAAIGLPGFANFAAEIMVFFGSFQRGWELARFHIFQFATVLALWGVVISAVYMLRAYRNAFMGSMPDRWKDIGDLTQTLRVPLALLIGALLWFGFFPQTAVRVVSPALRSSLTAPSPK